MQGDRKVVDGRLLRRGDPFFRTCVVGHDRKAGEGRSPRRVNWWRRGIFAPAACGLAKTRQEARSVASRMTPASGRCRISLVAACGVIDRGSARLRAATTGVCSRGHHTIDRALEHRTSQGRRARRNEMSNPPARDIALTPGEIVGTVRDILGTILPISGSVFFAGRASYGPGDVYVAGLNPAGLSDPIYSIERSLTEWLDRPAPLWSAFLDEAWPTDFQARMQALALALGGIDLRRSFSTNAFFVRTPGDDQLREFRPHGRDYKALWSSVMWPCHQLFLSVVRPKLLICLGYNEHFSSRSFFLSASENGKTRYGHTLRTCFAPGAELFEGVEFRLGGDSASLHRLAILALAHPTGNRQNLWPLDKAGVAKTPEQASVITRAVEKLRLSDAT
jgi:hypothetical protein